MKYFQIIFSPTGGTEKVANAITQNWSQVDTIDLSAADINFADISFESDSLVLIAMSLQSSVNKFSRKCLPVIFQNRLFPAAGRTKKPEPE